MDRNFLLLCLLAGIATVHSFNMMNVTDYLINYHYFNEADLASASLRSGGDGPTINQAIRLFQLNNGLEETGIADAETINLMQMPRCGLPDNIGTQSLNRARRYALADHKWQKTALTWKFENFTPDLPRSKTRQIIGKALKHWADASQLTFREVTSGNADIIIKFASGNHGDGNAFDGASGVLAHAYFPTPERGYSMAGDAHFDEAESYTDGTYDGTNLFQVAVHEFGHSLGLGHSRSPDAIMAAIYRGYVPNVRLNSDDIAGIQALYGANSGMPEVEGTEGPKATGDCIANFVAAAQTHTQGSYLFNETHAFHVDINGMVGAARPIYALFRGLPNNIDAAFYYKPTGKTYFFKGTQYWRFTDMRMDSGYPRNIRNGFGSRAPTNLDAAFVWSGNGMTYFVKDNMYYRFNFRTASMDYGYPKSLSVWNGIGTRVEAAFQFENQYTYFFADGEYRRFDDKQFAVARDYPRPSSAWLKCEEMALRASPTPADLGSANTTVSDADADADTHVDGGTGRGATLGVSVGLLLTSIAVGLLRL